MFSLILCCLCALNFVFTCIGCGSPTSSDDEQAMKLFIEKGTVFMFIMTQLYSVSDVLILDTDILY